MGYEDDDDLDSWGRSISHARPDSDNKTSLDWYNELSDKLKGLLGDVEPSQVNNSAPRILGKLDGVDETELTTISLDNFISKYFERNGKCFRTEIRDSGVYICGAHKNIWEDVDFEIEESNCPHVMGLASDFRDSVKVAANYLLKRDSIDYTTSSKNKDGNIIPSTFGESSNKASPRRSTVIVKEDDDYYYKKHTYSYDDEDWDYS